MSETQYGLSAEQEDMYRRDGPFNTSERHNYRSADGSLHPTMEGAEKATKDYVEKHPFVLEIMGSGYGFH
jgi:hypothetical protein